MLDIEPFIELFNDNVYYVGPYNDKDARKMLDELTSRRQKTYSPPIRENLLQSTGRYAGLLRAGFASLEELPQLDQAAATIDSLAEVLATRSAIRTECRTIWTSLNRSEQYVLKAVARLTPYNVSAETEHSVSMLMQKRLLRLDKTNQRLEIAPPVFQVFVASNPDPS